MHVHDRCISEPRLRIAFGEHAQLSLSEPQAIPALSHSPTSPNGDRSDSENDIDMPATPTTPPSATLSLHMPAKRRKSVGFATSPRRTIFRYLPAPDDFEDAEHENEQEHEGSLWSGSDDSLPDALSKENQKDGEEKDGETMERGWWWDGWEESQEGAAVPEAETGRSASMRGGRTRVRRKTQAVLM